MIATSREMKGAWTFSSWQQIGVLLTSGRGRAPARLAVLLLLRRRRVASGLLGLTYLALYPISQLVVFYWRTDAETPVVLLGLKQAQLTALFVLVVVVPVFVLAWCRTHQPSGRASAATAMGGTSR